MTDIKIKPLIDEYRFIVPERASEGSAAYDAFIQEDYVIKFDRQIIPLGFAVEMPPTLALDNRTRAGYAAFGIKAYDSDGNEYRINADVTLGLIDSDYRDECGSIVHVHLGGHPKGVRELITDGKLMFKRGQAISQLAFVNVPETRLVLVSELSATDRKGGFGKQNNEHITEDKN